MPSLVKRIAYLAIFAILAMSIITALPIIPKAAGSPVEYNTDTFNVPSRSTIFISSSAGLLMDTDADGYIDAFYDQSTSTTAQYVWTRRGGSAGITPITYNVPAGWVVAASVTNTVVHDNFIYFLEVNLTTNNMRLVAVNVLTAGSAVVAGPYNNANINTSYQGGGGFPTTAGTYVMAGTFAATNTNLWINGVNNAVASTALIVTPYMLGIQGNRLIDFTGTTTTGTTLTNGITSGAFMGHCGTSGCLYKSGSTFTVQGAGYGSYNYKGPRDMSLYFSGVNMPHSDTAFQTTPTYWADAEVRPDLTDNEKIVATLHPAFFGQGSPTVPRIIWEDGANKYIGLFTAVSQIQYDLITDYTSQFTNRHFEWVRPEGTLTGSSGVTAITSAIPASGHQLRNPAAVLTAYTGSGAFTLMSGYNAYPLSGTENHYIDSRWLNYNSTVHFYNPTGATFEMVIQVRGISSTDYALRIDDPTDNLGGDKTYIYMARELQSDKTVSVDVIADVCYKIYIRDISTELSSWDAIGNLCGNGASVKSVTYVSNIAFTFWSLPWGVTHRYNATTAILDTYVRHSTTPFSYDVMLYDSDGNLESANYETSVTSLDHQTYNLTGYAPSPLRMRVYDNSTGIEIYNTYLDQNPKYLSNIRVFFEDYTSFAGWNLLLFMPIVFAAMFTRNTVGLGTVLTVLMIGTLNWFGIIDMPDEIVLLLIFIAIIGLIAYRVLF